MFDCNQSRSTQPIGSYFLRFAIATLFVISFVTSSTAQDLQEDKKEILDSVRKIDLQNIKKLVDEFEAQVKEAFEKGELARKTGGKRNGRNLFEEATGGRVPPTINELNTLWDENSDLIADPNEMVGLTADSSASYGLLGFMGAKYDDFGNVCKNGEKGKSLTLKLSGRFPDAQYMSLQIYRGRPLQGSKDVGKTLSDYEIIPISGLNRFATGNRDDEGNFEIFIRPVDDVEAAEEAAEARGNRQNTIYYKSQDYDPDQDGDSTVITAFYRVYLPKGGRIQKEDLPTVEGFLTEPRFNGEYSHEDPLVLGRQVHPKFAKLVNSWYPDIPVSNVIFNISRFWKKKDSLRWFNVNKVFNVIEKFAGQGASQDLKYEMCFKQVAVGEYVVIKFLAPEIYFGGPPEQFPRNTKKAVRYWSICPVYYPRLAGINSFPCDPLKTEKREITVVFGKDRPDARKHAEALGAKFLPDTREESQRVVTFLMRYMLSTKSDPPPPKEDNKLANALELLSDASEVLPELKENKKFVELEQELRGVIEERWEFNGEYKPRGEVYSLREFLELQKENIAAGEVGDEK